MITKNPHNTWRDEVVDGIASFWVTVVVLGNGFGLVPGLLFWSIFEVIDGNYYKGAAIAIFNITGFAMLELSPNRFYRQHAKADAD